MKTAAQKCQPLTVSVKREALLHPGVVSARDHSGVGVALVTGQTLGILPTVINLFPKPICDKIQYSLIWPFICLKSMTAIQTYPPRYCRPEEK